MNQKHLKRILKLHSEGVSTQICATVLLQTVFGSSDPRVFEAAHALDVFYIEVLRKEVEGAKERLMCELDVDVRI